MYVRADMRGEEAGEREEGTWQGTVSRSLFNVAWFLTQTCFPPAVTRIVY